MCWETSFWIFNLLSTIFGTTRATGFQIWYLALKHSTNQFALNIRKLWTRITRFNPYGFLPPFHTKSSPAVRTRKWSISTCTQANKFSVSSTPCLATGCLNYTVTYSLHLVSALPDVTQKSQVQAAGIFYKSQVTGHCLTNTESILNMHKG